LLVVIGDPIDHSLSPIMHNAAIAALGLDAVYVAIRTDHGAVPHMVQAFEAAGIAGNVTVPHKLEVARLLIRLTALAKELGAVNTFWPDGGRLIGDNTDVHGVLGAIDQLEAEGPWLVVGTGGSARAVAAAARERDVPLLVRSRRSDRARDFAAWARDLGVTEALPDDGRPLGTVINATPLGLRSNDGMPVPPERLEECGAALDLVYAAGGTRWVRACRGNGLRAVDGRTMLVEQGTRAFEHFFPDVTAPRDVMAAAVERALAS
jgi:shikimate dehydrogenase